MPKTNIAKNPGRPSSDAFWVQADAFREAASALHDLLKKSENPPSVAIPITFLYLRSLELGCKSCLPEKEYPSVEDMKKFGHGLTGLLNELQKNKKLDQLEMCRNEFKIIDDFSDDYSYKRIEYGTGYIDYPDLDLLADLVDRFLDATR